MTPIRPTYTFRIDEELRAGLEAVYERDGIPVSEQVRRAVKEWLQRKGVAKAASRRVGARRKA
jgi:antitoxin component of RelBE/YafQ-DinJ toxin-antitoxin module